MRSRVAIAIFVLLVITVAVESLSAQQGTAELNGRVTDSSGLAVVGAKVQAINVATGVTFSGESNVAGLYEFPSLPTGSYRIAVTKEGFERIEKPGVDLHVSDVVTINFTVQVGSVTQNITVQSGAPLVETTESSVGGLVNDTQMADLPLNGRNYISLSLLQAGVSQNINQGTMAGMTGMVFSSNGAPVISNNYLLDGTSVVNESGWASSSMAGTTLGVDGIQEYKVITNAYNAEYGMTMGSQVIMVSKAGTNQFHGDVFDYLRNSALDARNFFDVPKIPEFQRNNFGGSFGGPIKNDKTFFYGVYEGLRQNQGFTVLDQVPAAGCHGSAGTVITNTQCKQLGSTPSVTISSATAALLTLFPNPTNTSNNTYTFPTPNLTGVNYGQIRIDHNFSPSDMLFGRYTDDESNISSVSINAFTAFSGVAFPQFRGAAASSDQFVTLSENHVFSPSLLNTARLSFSRTYFNSSTVYTASLPNIPTFVTGEPFGNLAIGGLSTIGGGAGVTASTPNSAHLQNLYSVADDINYSKGKHALKFGALINRYNHALTAPIFAAGSLTYASLATFLRGIPSQYSASSPSSDFNRDFIFNTVGLYGQDDWRATSRLTLNIGLRYEFMTTPWELSGKEYAIRNTGTSSTETQGPIMLNKSLLDFSPRVGFAWDVFGDGKTSIRGAAGIYYDLANLGGAFTRNADGMPPTSSQTRVSNQSTNAVITFPLTFTASQFGQSPSTINYHSNQPHVLQYNLSIERELPASTALTIAYIGTRGAHLWLEEEGNPTIPTAIVNDQEYWSSAVAACGSAVPSCRANPNFASNTDDTTGGDSWYNSLQVTATKRLSKGVELQAAYTYSHSIDTTEDQLAGTGCSASGMSEGVDFTFPRVNNLGPSCFDIRHNFRANVIYHFPTVRANKAVAALLNGWWTGNIISAQTGYPFTPVLGTNRSNSSILIGQSGVTDRADVGAATVAPGQIGPDGHANTTSATFIPFNPGTVYTGNVEQWFNPLMFSLAPMVSCPGAAALTCGTLGDVSRGLLRGPGLATWDFSLVKDTRAPFLGEQGNIEFRAEFFNFLNHANFGMPSGTVFSGATTDIGAYSESPLSTAGEITNTATTSRQIQIALKLLF